MKVHCLSFQSISKLFLHFCWICLFIYNPFVFSQIKTDKNWENKTAEEQINTQIVAGNDIPDKLSGNQLSEPMSRNQTKIPAALISLGWKSSDYALIVEKLLHKLTVYRSNFNGGYDVIKSYEAITGKKQGDKKSVGDKKTPEGTLM